MSCYIETILNGLILIIVVMFNMTNRREFYIPLLYDTRSAFILEQYYNLTTHYQHKKQCF